MSDLIHTTNDYMLLFLRIVAGVIIFPYGMQKLLGWFEDFGGGVGIQESLMRIKQKNIPVFMGWLIIIGQSFGSVALIIGCFGKFHYFYGCTHYACVRRLDDELAGEEKRGRRWVFHSIAFFAFNGSNQRQWCFFGRLFSVSPLFPSLRCCHLCNYQWNRIGYWVDF